MVAVDVGQIGVRQCHPGLFGQAFGLLDIDGGHRITDVARPRVQHDPHPLFLIQAHLDKVVAAAQGAQLQRAALEDFPLELPLTGQLLEAVVRQDRLPVRLESQGDGPLDLAPELRQ